MKLLLLLALCLPAWGQHNVGPVGAALTASGAIHADTQPNRVKGNPTNRLWRISLVTVAGASAADWASSLGHYERNALAAGAAASLLPPSPLISSLALLRSP